MCFLRLVFHQETQSSQQVSRVSARMAVYNPMKPPGGRPIILVRSDGRGSFGELRPAGESTFGLFSFCILWANFLMVAVLQPIKPGKLIPIDRAVVLVGRGSDCDAIIANSQKISRRHCCLVQVDNSYYLRDLGSMNGVWVNGARVTREAIMKGGDRVAIGDVEFVFHPNARIDQKKTVTNGKPSAAPTPATAGTANDAEATLAGSDIVAEVEAELPTETNQRGPAELIDSGILDVYDGDSPGEDEFEVIDDVIPLDDDDTYLIETNEVEIIDEPIIDLEGYDDDDEVVVYDED